MMRLYSPDGAVVYTANLVGAGVYEELSWSNSAGSVARWSVEVKATNATQAGDYDLYSYELAR